MKTSTDRILTTHVGSLPRPESIKALLRGRLSGQGLDEAQLAACVAEADADHAFGVPLFLFRGEQFWGHDRMPLLEERLTAAGLRR